MLPASIADPSMVQTASCSNGTIRCIAWVGAIDSPIPRARAVLQLQECVGADSMNAMHFRVAMTNASCFSSPSEMYDMG